MNICVGDRYTACCVYVLNVYVSSYQNQHVIIFLFIRNIYKKPILYRCVLCLPMNPSIKAKWMFVRIANSIILWDHLIRRSIKTNFFLCGNVNWKRRRKKIHWLGSAEQSAAPCLFIYVAFYFFGERKSWIKPKVYSIRNINNLKHEQIEKIILLSHTFNQSFHYIRNRTKIKKHLKINKTNPDVCESFLIRLKSTAL